MTQMLLEKRDFYLQNYKGGVRKLPGYSPGNYKV